MELYSVYTYGSLLYMAYVAYHFQVPATKVMVTGKIGPYIDFSQPHLPQHSRCFDESLLKCAMHHHKQCIVYHFHVHVTKVKVTG